MGARSRWSNQSWNATWNATLESRKAGRKRRVPCKHALASVAQVNAHRSGRSCLHFVNTASSWKPVIKHQDCADLLHRRCIRCGAEFGPCFGVTGWLGKPVHESQESHGGARNPRPKVAGIWRTGLRHCVTGRWPGLGGDVRGTKWQRVAAVRGLGSVAWDGEWSLRRRARSPGRRGRDSVMVQEFPPHHRPQPLGEGNRTDQGGTREGEFRLPLPPPPGETCAWWTTAVSPAEDGRGGGPPPARPCEGSSRRGSFRGGSRHEAPNQAGDEAEALGNHPGGQEDLFQQQQPNGTPKR